jgi:hypothetical protein
MAKDMERKELHHLRENDFSGIHDYTPKAVFSRDGFLTGNISSRLMT